MANIKSKLAEETSRFDLLAKERDSIQKKWNKDGVLNPVQLEILQLMMKESIQIVENVETSTLQ